ncbi:MAG: Jag N-terminal domain-containing protein [Campylobacteraceae bacterium]|jgi:spoIIIJ-associated protein|nr:Jag N-terminal domain-containing protein [Campylobacteraceae bacterium]
MIRVEANTLEEAYSKAAGELSCSVTELDLSVIQYPKNGFFGIGKKTAIVEAKRIGSKNFNQRNEQKNEQRNEQKHDKNFHNKNRNAHQHNNKKPVEKTAEKKEPYVKPTYENKKAEQAEQTKSVATASVETRKEHKEAPRKREPLNTSTPFDEQFHKEKTDPNSITLEVREKIKTLFDNLCFEVSSINVSVYDEGTLLIELDGPDAALLIGKEGCRYKALSYMFYSWINIKYGLGIRLEIAEFLKNQEEMMGRYLSPIIERIHMHGRGQTKILDGVLIKIALERLRGEFPEKYVGIKNGRDGGRFIVVNDFNRKNT